MKTELVFFLLITIHEDIHDIQELFKRNLYSLRLKLKHKLTKPSQLESTTEKIRSDKKEVVYNPKIPIHSLN